MKTRLLSLLLPLLLCATAIAQPDRPKVAVVLSGGGAKGVAHSGALRVIEQAGIPVDIITGTSMGSLVGALYSIGYTPDQIDSIILSQDWMALLSDRTDPNTLTLLGRQEQNTYAVIRGLSADRTERGGAIRGRNIMRLFRSLCFEYNDSINFDDLPIRYACVATDIITNTEVDIHSGRLVRAMRASMSIPGAFTPVRWGDSVLVDGGLKNNYPADLARAMGADIVIGVSVQTPDATADDITDAASVLNQLVNVNCRYKFNDNIALTDVFVRVDVAGFSSTSYSTTAIDSLIHRGYDAAMAHWDDLLALRRSYGIDSVAPRPASIYPHPIELPNSATRPLTRVPIGSAGFRFDTEEMGAILLGLKLPLPIHAPMDASFRVRLGRRLAAHGEVSLLTRVRGLNPTVGYTFTNNDLDIYTHGTRTYNVRYRTHSIDLIPLDFHLRRYDLRAGIRWDYYDYYGHLLTASGDIPPLDDEGYFSCHFSSLLNTENRWYFPTRGSRFETTLTLRSSQLIDLHAHTSFLDLLMHWRINIPLGHKLTLQPMLYTRLLFGDDIPVAFSNVVGGEWFGHYLEQQLPFAGIGHIELTQPFLAAAQIGMHYQLFNQHYLQLRLAAAYHDDHLLSDIERANALIGLQAGYTYLSIVGPLSVRVGYTNLTRQMDLFVSVGHQF